MAWISISGAVKALAAARKISLAGAKIEAIEACAAGLIEARWRGNMISGRPTHIERQKWIGADIDLSSGVVILADGRRMAQVEAKETDFAGWLGQRCPQAQSAAEPRSERASKRYASAS